MSLTASMWTSVSGLLAHGEKMNVIGDNIANVNTIGFKSSRMDFQDFVYQTVNAASGPAQVGRGVSINAIYGDFSQGGFEMSNEATDIAIGGNGFFRVRPRTSDDAYYTRAGNFRFDAEGYLVDPHGYILQGWQVELPTLSMATSGVISASSGTGSRIIGTGVPQDVRLASFSCDPRHTTSITLAVNLDQNCGAEKASNSAANPNYLGAGAYANAGAIAAAFPTAAAGNFVDNTTTGTEWTFNGATWTDSTNPIGTTSHVLPSNIFAAMWQNWDATPNAQGTIEPPLGLDGFTYQNSIKVYDEGGTPHTLTIYFDPVQDSTISPPDPTQNHWEYIVTMDPTEDIRNFDTGGTVPVAKKGLLMAGSISFSTSGEIKNMSAYVPTEGGANFANMSTWIAAPISSSGYPMFAANFTGQPHASEIWDPLNLPTGAAPGKLNLQTKGFLTELNLGIQSTSNWWTIPAGATPGTYTGLTMDQINQNVAARASMDGHAARSQPSSTAYGSKDGNNFFERYAHQDGYTYGELSSVFIDQDGVLSGRYSNGVTLQLFQITLYDFPSETNLHREGGNLFSQTRESGDPTNGAANSGSFGTVHSNSIEQSNVDLAREFVQMITTQRGFQANSKSITTVDTMLDTVINMKR
ncbi:MAG: flagellar hook-basal body complex protein [Deltaproteobacteria bacterium]|nr:flagellar hook-basal body complex protein [Deltaproteobacteria bacterium]